MLPYIGWKVGKLSFYLHKKTYRGRCNFYDDSLGLFIVTTGIEAINNILSLFRIQFTITSYYYPDSNWNQY